MKYVRKYLFFLLILLLPVNLGKHFDLDAAYISGITVDYLVPTIYLQDILVFLVIVAWLVPYKITKTTRFSNSFIFIVFFVFTSFLSFLLSEFPLTSFLYFSRILLYILLGIYIATTADFKIKEVFYLLIIPLVYISVLGVAQFINQGSIFDNYLVLGEQPYNTGLKAILKENFFNRSVIPPYSLFRHPNTFGGFLALLLPALWYFWERKKPKWFYLVFLLGFLNLLLSFSVVAITSFFLSFVLLSVLKKPLTILYYLIPLALVFGSLLLPVLTKSNFIKNEPSLYRRIELLNGAYNNLHEYLPFGIGLGTSTSLFRSSVFLTRDLSFFQPVHNIYVLILLECGIVALITLLLFFYFYYKDIHQTQLYLFIFYMQIAILGSYDHYLFTMHQTFLLLCLLFGLIYKNNKHLLEKK